MLCFLTSFPYAFVSFCEIQSAHQHLIMVLFHCDRQNNTSPHSPARCSNPQHLWLSRIHGKGELRLQVEQRNWGAEDANQLSLIIQASVVGYSGGPCVITSILKSQREARGHDYRRRSVWWGLRWTCFAVAGFGGRKKEPCNPFAAAGFEDEERTMTQGM